MINPMLGVNANLEKLNFPLFASTKLDGVRAMVYNNTVFSRTGKPIPNKFVQSLFSSFNDIDGELIVDSPTDKNVFQKTTSGVMTIEGEPNVYLYAFDALNCSGGIIQRYKKLKDIVNNFDRIKIIEQKSINNIDELLEFERKCISEGYEGVMLRNPTSEYKHGRSTINQGGLLKLKRFKDSEAEIIEVEQLIKITGEKSDEMGSIVVKDIKTNITFSIGTGFDDIQRNDIWKNRENYIGKIIKYKYFEVGTKDKPRFPVFLGFRNEIDL